MPIRLWSTTTLYPIGIPLRHPAAVMQIALIDGGNSLIAAAADGIVRKWRIFPKDMTTPQWLPDALEWRAGRAIDEMGALIPRTSKQGRPEVSDGSDWWQLFPNTNPR